MDIYFAPIQGITDAEYRAMHAKYFTPAKKYFTPFLNVDSEKNSSKFFKDLSSGLENKLNVIPQILGNSSEKLKNAIIKIQEFGFNEINFNMACPHPPVVNKKRGGGLIGNPGIVKEILDELCAIPNINLSVKTRLGITEKDEIFKLIPIFNNYPLKEIIIHGRTVKQMYKDENDFLAFNNIHNQLKTELIINGDISYYEQIQNSGIDFTPKKIMIGRGLLSNPYLISDFSGNNSIKNINTFINFHDKLIDLYSKRIASSHLIQKISGHWLYWSSMFSSPKKVFKIIKKTKSIKDYPKSVKRIINEYNIN